jgi:hypothetical protein
MASKKRKTQTLSTEDRTPLQLKSKDPDLTVVVGGVEFYHYQTILCVGCPLIDTMLAAKMKESEEGRIEFPDKDSEGWLLVYKFLVPTTSNDEKDALFQSLLADTFIARNPALELVAWFDFLGMESLVKKYDKVIAKHDVDGLVKMNKLVTYSSWVQCKHVPCPLTQKARKEHFKYIMLRAVYNLSRQGGWENIIGNAKKYLLDDDCGEEMWQYLVSKLKFPNRMLEEIDRKTFANSPLFTHMLEVYGKVMDRPDYLFNEEP